MQTKPKSLESVLDASADERSAKHGEAAHAIALDVLQRARRAQDAALALVDALRTAVVEALDAADSAGLATAGGVLELRAGFGAKEALEIKEAARLAEAALLAAAQDAQPEVDVAAERVASAAELAEALGMEGNAAAAVRTPSRSSTRRLLTLPFTSADGRRGRWGSGSLCGCSSRHVRAAGEDGRRAGACDGVSGWG